MRLLQCLLVATILIAFLSSEEKSALAPSHVPAGWIAAILIAFRIAWGFLGGKHARFADFLNPRQGCIISVAFSPISCSSRSATQRSWRHRDHRADLHPGVADARPPAPPALPVAAVVTAGTTYGAAVVAPLAFTPGAHADAGTHNGGPEKGERGDD